VSQLTGQYGQLCALFLSLKKKIEGYLGHEIYDKQFKDGRGWTLYRLPGQKGVFANISIRTVRDGIFDKPPFNYSPPHLRVASCKGWADKANVPYEAWKAKYWYQGEQDECYWCLPLSDQKKLNEVAQYLTTIF